MKLKIKEKNNFDKAKTEDDFYSEYSKVRDTRNGFLPNYLVREVLEIFNNKFPKNHSED